MPEVPFVSEEELLAKLEKWLAAREEPPTIFELIELGDRELMAAMLLKASRAATREAAIAKLDRAAAALGDVPIPAVNCALRVFASITDEWTLSSEEQQAILGIENGVELQKLRGLQIDDVPIAVIERISVVLDISHRINALLSGSEQASTWVRAPNAVQSSKARSALQLMMESLDGIYAARQYLLRWSR